MSEIMDHLNLAERKLSQASLSANTANSMTNGLTDAAGQLIHRQQHAQTIEGELREMQAKGEPILPGDLSHAIMELGQMTDRCPMPENIVAWGRESMSMHDVVQLELSEARELMAKAREIEGTRITHGG